MPYENILKDDVILKLAILFTAKEFGKPLTNPELTKFILNNNEIDYFLLQHNIYELVKMEKMRVFKEFGKDFYAITDDGAETVGFFYMKIPYLVRKNILLDIDRQKVLSEPQTKISADFEPSGNEFIAGVKILDKGQEQFSVNIIVPTRDHAVAVCDYLEENAADIYRDLNQKIMELF